MSAQSPVSLWFPAAINLVAVAGLWLYYAYRNAWSRRPAARSTVFRCAACGAVYADDSGVPRVGCPRCGHHNDAARA